MRVKLTEKDVLNPLGEVEGKNLTLNPLPYDFNNVSLVDNTKPGAQSYLRFSQNHWEIGNFYG